MEIGYAVMFITWLNIMNFVELKTIETKIDNIIIKQEEVIFKDKNKNTKNVEVIQTRRYFDYDSNYRRDR